MSEHEDTHRQPFGESACPDARDAPGTHKRDLDPWAPEYSPLANSSGILVPESNSVILLHPFYHSQLVSIPQGSAAYWPYLGCLPVSPENASPEESSSFHFLADSYGGSLSYSCASTGQTAFRGNSCTLAGWGSTGCDMNARGRAASRRNVRPSSASSSGSAISVSTAGTRAMGHEPHQQNDAHSQATSMELEEWCSSGDTMSDQPKNPDSQEVVSGSSGQCSGSIGVNMHRRKRGQRGGDCRMRSMSRDDVQSHRERTIYISEVAKEVTEEMLAKLFMECGPLRDVRVCGDATQELRFAFLEFEEMQAVELALRMTGREVAGFPLRISRSKTATKPVNTCFLPRTMEECEQCSRTIYVSNLDPYVGAEQLAFWFEEYAGPVSAIRVKGDMYHRTNIAFIEFEVAVGAQKALQECSGALLGMFPIRILPSKTPVRTE